MATGKHTWDENPSSKYGEEQAKGFSLKGIPDVGYDEANMGEANPMTPPEKETLQMKEDMG